MIDEFVCIWFETNQRWVVLFPNGETINEKFDAIGYAVNSALARINASEADFECVEDTGEFYRYVRDRTCLICGGDCASANPPVNYCPNRKEPTT
jgi:hypothetical protein